MLSMQKRLELAYQHATEGLLAVEHYQQLLNLKRFLEEFDMNPENNSLSLQLEENHVRDN